MKIKFLLLISLLCIQSTFTVAQERTSDSIKNKQERLIKERQKEEKDRIKQEKETE